MRLPKFLAFFLIFLALPAFSATLTTVTGVVHDSQHFPVAGATVTLSAADSALTFTTATDPQGGYLIPTVPIGNYRLSISAKGFAVTQQTVTVVAGASPVLHTMLAVAQVNATVQVSAPAAQPDSITTTTLVSRALIDETPGADRTLGMTMVTDYVPGAYMTHDMLHMRGGHQTTWLIDGVAIPNTKIASNVGPQIDPKDIDQLEIDRGSYAADLGDRTYGVFNVLPRSGFERNRQGEFLINAGNFYSGESQLSLGDHSQRTAWYTSLTGSRSNYGLATPVASVNHDATSSESAFLSLVQNQTPRDQFRLNAQFRNDYFQVPYDPNPNDWEQQANYYNSYGLRDAQSERDGFLIANWVHTLSPRTVVELAPFYHLNQSNYDSNPNDQPVATTWHQGSTYLGGQGDLRTERGPNNLSGGFYSFFQHENDLFGTQVNDGSATSQPNTTATANAGLVEFYLADHLRVGRYITLIAGERFSFYRSTLNETAIYPRIGATFQIPRLNWVLRGYYGHFFQPAPILTVSSSVLNYATSLGGGEDTFTPLPSERDEEHQFGLQIPYRGWLLDVANTKNRVNNFLDHSNLGESNMYFPIAVDGALVRSWELTVRSPQLARFGQFHLTYANQIAEQRGNIIGGFTCSIPGDPACTAGDFSYGPVDHDQRNTLNTGFTATLPRATWLSTNVYYGSGFTNGLAGANQGPWNGNYLPVHTTFDLSGGHSFGENWRLSAAILNVTNHRVLLDNSVTIGGFHYNDPRMLSAQLKYRFHF